MWDPLIINLHIYLDTSDTYVNSILFWVPSRAGLVIDDGGKEILSLPHNPKLHFTLIQAIQ